MTSDAQTAAHQQNEAPAAAFRSVGPRLDRIREDLGQGRRAGHPQTA